jgi:hypothetical protein
MVSQAGGCLCDAVRYEARAEPLRVTLCHCRFCQRATGAACMVEPIFQNEDLTVTRGTPAIYSHRSAGSGKLVHVHFCQTCGTKLYLTFERFPDVCGVYAGTFDVPDWFGIDPENAKQIFIEEARSDSILMPGINAFREHATLNDGTPAEPAVYGRPHIVGRLPAR